MRTVKLAAVLLVLLATPVLADVAGVYDVKFEEQQTNCTSPLRYAPGKLTIKIRGKTLSVDVDRTPLMTGIPAKTGKISAKSKSGPTMIEGMRGVFTVAGKVTPEGLLHLVMIGEYTANGKPLCSQSWNVSGPKSDEKKTSRRRPSWSHPDRGQRRPIMSDLVHLTRFGG